MFERFDHVAIEVDNFDERVQALVERCSMRLIRSGARFSTGQRIAMLGDGTGLKIELIESTENRPSLAHIAFRVADTDQAHDALVRSGWTSKHPPHDLEAAKARTALLSDGRGLDVQVVSYDPRSPDVMEWPRSQFDSERGGEATNAATGGAAPLSVQEAAGGRRKIE